MPKLAFVADPHISNHRRVGGAMVAGINDRCRLALDAFRTACLTAASMHCDTLYVIGDLFDNIAVGPRIITAVQDIIIEARAKMLRVVISTGNHDSVTKDPGDHALGPLKYLTTIVDKPFIERFEDVDVVVLPYYPGPAAVWLRQALAEVQREDSETDQQVKSASTERPRTRILALHLGVSHDGTPGYMQDDCSLRLDTVQNLLREFRYSAMFAGHWHDFFQSPKQPVVIQLGALAPTGWDNPGTYNRGMMGVFADGAIQYVSVPGPRFVQVRGQPGYEVLKKVVQEATGSAIFVDWLVPPDEAEDARADLEILRDRKLIHHGMITLDTAQATDDARRAATAARSAATLSESISAYVEKITLPAQVQRDRVLQLTRRFVGLAS